MTSKGNAHDVCRLCESSQLSTMFDFGNMPIAHRLVTEKGATESTFPFVMQHCEKCGFMQISDPIPADLLYSSYNYNFSSWKSEPHIDDELARIKALKAESVIEIGSNDGRFLSLVREQGAARIVGIEPNPVSGEAARSNHGLQVYGSLLTPEITDRVLQENGEFDLLVVRQVVEHVPDLATFFNCVRRLVRDGGHVFIDVPDMAPAMKVGDCSVLWEEHVNYFTRATLTALLHKHGFEITDVSTYDFSGGTLSVVARKMSSVPKVLEHCIDQATDPIAYAEKVFQYAKRLKEALSRSRRAGCQIVIYGVGVRACTASNALRLGEYIDFAVDDQPERQGKWMPGSQLEIHSSDLLKRATKPLVCILAVNAENEHKVKHRVSNLVSTPIQFVSVCAPTDIWNELEALEKYNLVHI